MSAKPILEWLGNPRTLRNYNNSRFGKFVRIFFELDSSLGTSVETYFEVPFEKTRVVHQNDGEWSFHVFDEVLNWCG